MYAYVLAFDVGDVDPEELRKEIDDLDEPEQIVNWWTPFPGMMVLVSELPARELSLLLRAHTALSDSRFLVADLETDRNGWLPKHGWAFMRNPSPANKDKE